MSYNVQLKCENGTVTVASASDNVPDGVISVSGHEDAGGRSISVGRSADGKTIVTANCYGAKEAS